MPERPETSPRGHRAPPTRAGAAAFFAGFSYANKRLHVLWFVEAKKQETRSARVAKAIEMLSELRTR